MRMSRLLGRTLRRPPADVAPVAHQLLLRAGMLCRLEGDRVACLPLGWRVLTRIASLWRHEVEAAGGQEMLFSAPTCRDPNRGSRATSAADVGDEMIAALLRREVDSYRQLPLLIYYHDFHDCGGPESDLQFGSWHACSAHTDLADRDAFYASFLDASRRVFADCGLAPLTVEAENAESGEATAHEFVVLSEHGPAAVLLCDSCGYAASASCATFDKRVSLPADAPPTDERPLEIATPDCTTIAQVAAFVGVPTRQTMKAVFFATVEERPRLVFVVIRGDLEVNEVRLRRVLGGVELRPAEEDEIRAVGAVPGYASPIGICGAMVVADDSLLTGSYVAGANRDGYHLRGVRCGRDFAPDVVADIALARDGDRCPRCGGRLRAEQGMVLGRCRKLEPGLPGSPEPTYLDATGRARPVVIGSYSVAPGQVMVAIVQEHHDEHGICWPPSVAPYHVHLVSLLRGEAASRADELYKRLCRAGIEVLYDDRPGLSAGVRFNDADLIGCPLRLTISKRSLDRGGVEAKTRTAAERRIIPLEEIESHIALQL